MNLQCKNQKQVSQKRNLARKQGIVKDFALRVCNKFSSVLLATVLCASGAQAATGVSNVFANDRAIQNATRISTTLHAVDAERLLTVVNEVANGKIQRVAPEQPVWILEIISGTILYYQGQPNFAKQPAAQLIDDDGFRFGQKAIENGKASHSGWLLLHLGGKNYRAYCVSTYPTVVCSLATS